MMRSVDIAIPVAVLVGRWENHVTDLRQELHQLPFWKFRRRNVLGGAIAAYCIEIDRILEIGGACQPVWEPAA